MHTDNKKTKTIIQITVIALAVLVLAFSTIGILKFLGHTETSIDEQAAKNQAQTSAKAKAAYANANELLKKGDTEGAKKAFENARGLYKQAGDTSHDKDITSSLSLIEKGVIPGAPTQQPALATP